MNAWKLEAGRCITTPDGTFSLTYGTEPGSNAPRFRDFCELDRIARQVAVLPELIEALHEMSEMVGDAYNVMGYTRPPPQLVAARAALAKVQP